MVGKGREISHFRYLKGHISNRRNLWQPRSQGVSLGKRPGNEVELMAVSSLNLLNDKKISFS